MSFLFLLLKNSFNYLSFDMCLWVHALVKADAYDVQKRASGFLELQLQGVVSHPVWVLQSKSGPSARAMSALYRQVTTPSPFSFGGSGD